MNARQFHRPRQVDPLKIVPAINFRGKNPKKVLTIFASSWRNRFGGRMEAAVGISEEQLRRAARSAVCKISIDSDGRLAITAILRKIFAEKPKEFDPRKYLGPARDELIKMVRHKNENVLMSAGKA